MSLCCSSVEVSPESSVSLARSKPAKLSASCVVLVPVLSLFNDSKTVSLSMVWYEDELDAVVSTGVGDIE